MSFEPRSVPKIRLRILMFLQFFSMGAIGPIFSYYLTRVLGFSGQQAGLIISVSAVAGVVSPLVSAGLADRVLSSNRLFSICHILAGCFLLTLYYQDSFWPFFIIAAFNAIAFTPTVALGHSICFHFLGEAERSRFGGIKVWGTLGWVAVAWVFGYGWLRSQGDLAPQRVGDALLVAAICSFCLSLYAFGLPETRVKKSEPVKYFPTGMWKVVFSKRVLLVLVLIFLSSFVDGFFYFGMGPFLKDRGFSEAGILPVLSIAQVPEILMLFVLYRVIRRFGYRTTIMLGVFCQIARFVILFSCQNPAILILGIACHGAAFALFFVTATIFLDSCCSKSVRAGVHLMLTFTTAGLARFISPNVAGFAYQYSQGDFSLFWLAPLVASCVMFILVFLFFPKYKTV